ncbi:MAG TPA: GNAT family N-acetyltransferase [Nanoarchaeota archaeon]|nr:GNAT family N-acetyltransferase [Nanoarchaeota archaeon]
MIRRATSEDAKGIIKLVSSIFPNESIVRYGHEALHANLIADAYISYVAEVGHCIVGHAGIFVNRGIATLNALVVSPDFRGRKYARAMNEKRLEYCETNDSITHAVIYSMLQHSFGQRLYDASFRPIGVSLSEGNPFSQEDGEIFGRDKINAEIALCHARKFGQPKIRINYAGKLRGRIQKIYDEIKIPVEFHELGKYIEKTLEDNIEIDLSKEDAGSIIAAAERQDFIFLGILPSIKDGLNIIGFASPEFIKNYQKPFSANTKEREEFVRSILYPQICAP